MECSDSNKNLWASAVCVRESGLLILGETGSGKSGLALRMIALGAELVADDRVLVRRRGEDLLLSAPDPLRGLIEARGLGILRLPAKSSVPLRLVVDLDRKIRARMPQPQTFTCLGVSITLIAGGALPNIASVLTTILRQGEYPLAEPDPTNRG